MIQRNNPQPRLSASVVHNGLIYLSGQVATNLDADIKKQTQEVLDKIDALLKAADSDRSHILTAQIWLKNMPRDFARFNELWEAWIPNDQTPARAAIEANLARPEILVEIMLTAAQR